MFSNAWMPWIVFLYVVGVPRFVSDLILASGVAVVFVAVTLWLVSFGAGVVLELLLLLLVVVVVGVAVVGVVVLQASGSLRDSHISASIFGHGWE